MKKLIMRTLMLIRQSLQRVPKTLFVCVMLKFGCILLWKNKFDCFLAGACGNTRDIPITLVNCWCGMESIVLLGMD